MNVDMITLKSRKQKGLRTIYLILVFMLIQSVAASLYAEKVLRIAVAGMSHGHISFIMNRPDKGDFKLVGVCESDNELIEKMKSRYRLESNLIYSNLEEMLDKTKPEVVVAFGSIYDHLSVVKACAPRGIHVMVEKPLAVSMEHANEMAELARKHQIHLLTNYETSWYPTTALSMELVQKDNFVGKVRKVVIHDGHRGPKEIGCDKFFLGWLTDPVLNGGGAVVDFGCYGANLMTALTKGEKPVAVTAVLRQFKPDVYPKVDDNATIIVSYPESECIIQASWNWPFDRKDIEIYGTKGVIFADNSTDMRLRSSDMPKMEQRRVTENDVEVYKDPFAYLYDVITGKKTQPSYGLYSLENNLMVVRILDAARESAKTGKTVVLAD